MSDDLQNRVRKLEDLVVALREKNEVLEMHLIQLEKRVQHRAKHIEDAAKTIVKPKERHDAVQQQAKWELRMEELDKMKKIAKLHITEAPKTTNMRPKVFLDIEIHGKQAGRVVIELFSDIVPHTSENFRELCTGENGVGMADEPLHYKGAKFNKVGETYIQGGELVHNAFGESIYGWRFADENFIAKHDRPGILSMAHTGGRNTNSSLFHITTAKMESWDGLYVVFGAVVSGMDVVKAIQTKKAREVARVHGCGMMPGDHNA